MIPATNLNTGLLRFTPANNASGNGYASFTFQVQDNGGTANGGVDLDPSPKTCTINVTSVNDAPVASAQSVSTAEDTAKGITLTGSDVENSPLTFAIVTNPTNGVLNGLNPNTGSVTYSPNVNFNGADSFAFTVNDGSLTSAVASVTITVTAVNDAPVANNQSVGTTEDTSLPITLTGNDVDGPIMNFTVVGPPAHGTLSGTAPNLSYQPVTNYNGTDSFTFTVNDGSLTSTVAAVSITVTAVNDAPAANNDVYTLGKNTSLTIPAPGVLGNDTDPDGDTLAALAVLDPGHGVLTMNTNGGFTYTPASNYFGTDAFIYQVGDGATFSLPALVNLIITNINRMPVANDQTVTATRDTPQALMLTASDADNDPLTYAIVSSPAHGVISGFNTNSGGLTYTPDAGYTGPDSFTFHVKDGTTNSAAASVSLTILDNTPPEFQFRWDDCQWV
jgi:hypothetical protein